MSLSSISNSMFRGAMKSNVRFAGKRDIDSLFEEMSKAKLEADLEKKLQEQKLAAEKAEAAKVKQIQAQKIFEASTFSVGGITVDAEEFLALLDKVTTEKLFNTLENSQDVLDYGFNEPDLELGIDTGYINLNMVFLWTNYKISDEGRQFANLPGPKPVSLVKKTLNVIQLIYSAK